MRVFALSRLLCGDGPESIDVFETIHNMPLHVGTSRRGAAAKLPGVLNAGFQKLTGWTVLRAMAIGPQHYRLGHGKRLLNRHIDGDVIVNLIKEPLLCDLMGFKIRVTHPLLIAKTHVEAICGNEGQER